jgi:hypothetical protein
MSLTQKTLMMEFDDLSPTPAAPSSLTPDQQRVALDNKGLIIGWLDALEAMAMETLLAGGTVPGYKLVAGRSNRQWSNEVDAEKVLVDALAGGAYETKLLSPAKAEKALGKKRAAIVETLIIKKEGAPTLAPESDKRPPIGATIGDFDTFNNNIDTE